ncbi:MAG: hypothetical protein OEM39_09515, partial [Acidimicrobiia bacterium]|nr:hypothetical protein [Acidimicrobiia bacterium]
ADVAVTGLAAAIVAAATVEAAMVGRPTVTAATTVSVHQARLHRLLPVTAGRVVRRRVSMTVSARTDLNTN